MAPVPKPDSDGFLPSSATTSKARKAAKSSKSNNKNKPKSTFLPTQPNQKQVQPDVEMDDMGFERLPLHESVAGPSTGGAKVTKEDAEAAMNMEVDGSEDVDEDDDDDDEVLLNSNGPTTTTTTTTINATSYPPPVPVLRTPISLLPSTTSSSNSSNPLSFPAISHATTSGLTQRRKIGIPPHRMTPLKRDWIKVYTPLVEECGLQVRMNAAKKVVELKTSKHTPSPSSLTRASDFLGAYALGFAVEDAIALLRLEELYVESFEIKDVKTLHGDHLSRAIGRIAGHEGKTRFVIENASRTRVVLADTKIHILGTFSNIKIARDAICALILGSPPGKIYAGLRMVASRSRERF